MVEAIRTYATAAGFNIFDDEGSIASPAMPAGLVAAGICFAGELLSLLS